MTKAALLFSIAMTFLLSACSATNGRFVKSGMNSHQIKQALNQQHHSWKGVRYKMGGTGKDGVDCSGFIYRTFKDQAGITLPRSTEQQSTLGAEIDREQLRPGDLVFFKTGGIFKSRHVGIYMGNGQFLHASTSRGVMKSSLNNPYWKDTYWQSRRFLRVSQ